MADPTRSAGTPGKLALQVDGDLRLLGSLKLEPAGTDPNSPYIPSAGGAIAATSFLPWGKDSGYHLKSPLNPSGAAKFDGVTNDTTSWQAAITAAQSVAGDGATTGGLIIVPPGVSVQTASLTGTAKGVRFWGYGKVVSVLKRANTVNQVQVQLNAGATDWTFEQMGFDQNGQNQTSNWHSVSMLWTSDNVTVQHCSFTNVEGFFVFVNFDAVNHRVNNLRVLYNDVTQFAGVTHDTCSIVTQGGCVIGNRITVHGTGSGLDIYESNDCPVTANSVLMAGDGGHGISLMSCDSCPATCNTVFAGVNDNAFWIRKETDNGFARASIATLCTGNSVRGVASTVNFQLETTSDCSIVANQIDGGYLVQYNIAAIDKVELSHNRIRNLTALQSVNVVPTNLIRHDNPGESGTPASSALGANVTSVTPAGRDQVGTIVVVMAGALAANTRIATITFASTFGGTAPIILLTNQTSGAGLAIVNPYMLAQVTGVSFDLACNQALAAGTYTFGYQVVNPN
jgi:hypothetical protein